ncbi:MAG: hypothetical protein KJ788_13990 [Gammaproteobacteria bacterium]|nr:hypothetical protein [Gammaproteobacteria bacterium]
MTVIALAVTAASVATIGVITGVIPERDAPDVASTGAAAAAFASSLPAMPLSANETTTHDRCEDCATVISIQPPPTSEDPGRAGRELWQIAVRLDDGSLRMLAAESQPSWHAGARVRVVDDSIFSM